MPSQQAIFQYDKDGRLTQVTFANGNQITYQYDSMGNRTSVMTALVSTGNLVFDGFRLSLSSTDPVPAGDILAATTLYLVPYTDDLLTLVKNDNTLFTDQAAGATISLSLASILAGKAYNIYASDPTATGTIGLSLGAAWTNLTTPSETLVRNNPGGFLVLSTDHTKRYMGTIYATANGQVNDALKDRGVFNNENRILRRAAANENTGSWNPPNGVIRPRNNNTTEGVGRFGVMIGRADDAMQITIGAAFSNTSAFVGQLFGFAIDSTTAFSRVSNITTTNATVNSWAVASFTQPSTVGRHFVQAMEEAITGTVTGLGGSPAVFEALIRM